MTNKTFTLPVAVEHYCEGAAMAYRDVAAKLRQMCQDCPAEVRPFMEAMLPFAATCELKAKAVFKEAAEFVSGVRQ